MKRCCVFLISIVFLAILGCKPKAIDFSRGMYGFLAVDESPAGAAAVHLALTTYGEKRAVRAELKGAGPPYIVIDASSLLGSKVSLLRAMEITLGLERDDGEFYAVSGEIRANSGTERRESAGPWSVYLPEKNPNIARVILKEAEYFTAGADNFFILTRKVDNALEAGKNPSNLIIYHIRFLDEKGNELAVNPKAVFRAPEGFGEEQ